MYDKERFILKTHFSPSPLDLIAIGKTEGWNSQIFKNAARDITLERNATVTGRGLPLASVTDDIDSYIGTPEWHDTDAEPRHAANGLLPLGTKVLT